MQYFSYFIDFLFLITLFLLHSLGLADAFYLLSRQDKIVLHFYRLCRPAAQTKEKTVLDCHLLFNRHENGDER